MALGIVVWPMVEPLWFGRERKKETLDGFFREQL
jgi:hypothetical protein